MRDKEEEFIPKTSTIGRKNSNIFGSIESNLGENIELNYNFALDNDISTFEYNELNATFRFENFETTFSFIEENEIGDSNILKIQFHITLKIIILNLIQEEIEKLI